MYHVLIIEREEIIIISKDIIKLYERILEDGAYDVTVEELEKHFHSNGGIEGYKLLLCNEVI